MDFARLKARFERSLAGEVVVELVRLEVVERSLALASKLFVAVIPLSIIISAVVPGADNFGDSLVNRLGLTGAGAEATRTLFATNGEIRGAVSVLGVVILLYSVFSFARGLQRVYLDVWRLPAQQFEAVVRRATWVVTFVAFTALFSPLRDFTERNDLHGRRQDGRVRLRRRTLALDAVPPPRPTIALAPSAPHRSRHRDVHRPLLALLGGLPAGDLHRERQPLRPDRDRLRDGHLAVRLRRGRDRRRRGGRHLGQAPPRA